METSIRISKKDWGFLQDEASKFNKASDKFLVFACFSKRRTHWDILEVRKLPIKLIKVGSGFSYIYPGIKKLGFYPERNSSKRFCGTFVIGDGVELSLGDAYWMGREQLDFRIKMERDDAGQLIYEAWAFDRNSDDVCPVAIEIV
jgi:hypothetical protein